MLEIYPNEVKLVFKDFPLNNHKFAVRAALAVHAAERQGKFWEFHDQLFNNSNRLSDEKISEIARELNLDMDQFVEDMKNSEIGAKVNRDIQEGGRIGVGGIPTVFINGKQLKDRTLKGFQALIEKELEKVEEKYDKGGGLETKGEE